MILMSGFTASHRSSARRDTVLSQAECQVTTHTVRRGARVAAAWSIGRTNTVNRLSLTRTHSLCAYVIKRSIPKNQKHTDESLKNAKWNPMSRLPECGQDVKVAGKGHVSRSQLVQTGRGSAQQRRASVTSSYWCRASAQHTLLIWEPVQITGAVVRAITWQERDDPLLRILLPSFNWELVKYLHLQQ